LSRTKGMEAVDCLLSFARCLGRGRRPHRNWQSGPRGRGGWRGRRCGAGRWGLGSGWSWSWSLGWRGRCRGGRTRSLLDKLRREHRRGGAGGWRWSQYSRRSRPGNRDGWTSMSWREWRFIQCRCKGDAPTTGHYPNQRHNQAECKLNSVDTTSC
jgi:hypothetical protein